MCIQFLLLQPCALANKASVLLQPCALANKASVLLQPCALANKASVLLQLVLTLHSRYGSIEIPLASALLL